MATIEFANRERRIRLNIRAMRDAERLTGKTTADIIRDYHDFSITMLGVLLFVGCKHEDKKLTLEAVNLQIDAYENMSGGGIKALRKAVTAAIDEATWWKDATAPEEEEKDGEEEEGEGPNSRTALAAV